MRDTLKKAIRDKSIAVSMCQAIDAELRDLRKLRKSWNTKLGEALRRIQKFAAAKDA